MRITADPDPKKKFMNPQHCLVVILTFVICFRGKVYATEPSVLLGRLFMEEMAEFLDRSPKPRQSARWKTLLRHLPPPLGDLKASTGTVPGDQIVLGNRLMESSTQWIRQHARGPC